MKATIGCWNVWIIVLSILASVSTDWVKLAYICMQYNVKIHTLTMPSTSTSECWLEMTVDTCCLACYREPKCITLHITIQDSLVNNHTTDHSNEVTTLYSNTVYITITVSACVSLQDYIIMYRNIGHNDSKFTHWLKWITYCNTKSTNHSLIYIYVHPCNIPNGWEWSVCNVGMGRCSCSPMLAHIGRMTRGG